MSKPKWLKSVQEIVFGQRKVVADIDAPTALRLSQTKEIQLAFQQEMARILNEAGENAVPPTPPTAIPTIVDSTLDGAGFRRDLDELEQKGSLQTLGFKPEHIRVLKSLAFLLGQCSRLSATAQNLTITLPLFHPVHPITPTVADACEEVIAVFVKSIE
jgi:hypothetical protein